MADPDQLRRAYETARDDLLAERIPAGHWVGKLSSSALSTATAVSALSVVAGQSDAAQADAGYLQTLIAGGLEWLARHRNPDGGWGDTDRSHSNLSTTMLVRAAFHLAGTAERHAEMLRPAEKYIDAQGGIPGLRKRYGKDKTFAVPILTNCALAGLVPWREVSRLPFELACLPPATYRFLRLPVVSYAIPALVAIGQARHVHCKPLNPITRLVRRLAAEKSLAVVERMQPASGGFLEATPLTSFVVMSLAGIGRTGHPVVRRGVEFLIHSVRDDGSWPIDTNLVVRRGVEFLIRSVGGDGAWPIDTNLATWVTTLSINALAGSGEDVGRLGCLDWLLSCQHQELHPFTGAAPGGWGWSDLSGAVPDADDTAGALLALAAMRQSARQRDGMRIDSAATAGIQWLLDLQNGDGGWPTFCRGWGKLPFDRSGVDLTAHAIRALHAWDQAWESTRQDLLTRMLVAINRGFSFLAQQQRADGRWVPLWFGNQDDPAEENPVYGTGRVLLAYRDLDRLAEEPAQRGLRWLASNQNADGGWGGAGPDSSGDRGDSASSVEETAVAVEALASIEKGSEFEPALGDGLAWLIGAVDSGGHRQASPIGFYFARLWYYEKLYPLVFTVSALGRALGRGCPEPGR